MIINNSNTVNPIDRLFEDILNLNALAIVGLSKNSGKTSLLNFLLSRIDTDKKRVGVLTTGRDGEKKDLVFKSDKPEVILKKGVLFSTFYQEASIQSPFIEIKGILDIETPMGKIVIAETKVDIKTQIIGPPSVYEQKYVVNFIRNAGAELILIDGSLDRRSILLSELCEGVIYVAGASYTNKVPKIVSELEKEYNKSLIPQIDQTEITTELSDTLDKNNIIIKYKNGSDFYLESLLGKEKQLMTKLKGQQDKIKDIFINTSFTDRVFDKVKHQLRKFKGRLIFLNSFNILLNEDNFKLLLTHCDTYTIHSVPLLAFGVNSFSDTGYHIDCEELRNTLRSKYPNIPILDIMEAPTPYNL